MTVNGEVVKYNYKFKSLDSVLLAILNDDNLGEKFFVTSQKNKAQVRLGNELRIQTDTKVLTISKILCTLLRGCVQCLYKEISRKKSTTLSSVINVQNL